MSSKKNNSIVKGQTKLFSFFQKTTPANNNQTTKSTIDDFKKDQTSIKDVNKIKSVISDDEEVNNKKKGTINKKKSALSKNHEDDWDANISDDQMDTGPSSGEEYSDPGDVSDSDDDVFLEDTDSDDDKHANKRRRLQKGGHAKASSTTKSSCKNRRKPTVTPDPNTTTTPKHKLTYYENATENKNLTSRTSTVITPGTNSSMKTSPFFKSGSTTPGYVNALTSESSTPKQNTSSDPLLQIDLPEGVVGRGSHDHNKLSFLQPDKIKDAKGRRPDHPEYNSRTLLVPNDYLSKQTPAMAQWWQLKSVNMDTVLFFKVGKFYELFHMDADVGFKELNLIYMKGTKAHSGFPEISYGKFASNLVAKGFRVARVEQTETPEMLKERNDKRSAGKKDRVVIRELCSIMTKGTRTYCHLDDLSLLADGDNYSAGASMLICIKEKFCSENHATIPEYGICCVDTVIGSVTLAQFQDDEQRSRLRTFLARYRATEVLLESSKHSEHTLGALRLLVPQASVEYLRGGEEIPSGESTVAMLRKGRYYDSNCKENSTSDESDFDTWPSVMRAVVSGLEDGSSELILNAIGGALWQLRRSMIDFEVISLGKVYAYIPPDEQNEKSQPEDNATTKPPLFKILDQEHHEITFSTLLNECGNESNQEKTDAKLKNMILDEVALSNLEILVNNYDRTEKGSLWAFINRCKTAFGRRLLRSWLCHPLYCVSDIKRRQDAVAELLSQDPDECLTEKIDQMRTLSRNIPDLERLLSRVHSNGLRKKSLDHPDSRAVMYENYNVRKIKDFADLLTGMETILNIVNLFAECTVASSLLRIAVKPTEEGGKFPRNEVTKLLKYFREIFDEKQAKKEGNIKPRPGIDPDYDSARNDINNIQTEFEEYLREMKRKIGVSDMKYFGSGKDRYQLEVPIQQSNKVPSNWNTKSQKKTHRRYWTAEIESKLARLISAEDRMLEAQRDTLRRIFERFDENASVWNIAVSCIALLDALQSLAMVSSFPNYTRPDVLEPLNPDEDSMSPDATIPMLEIHSGRHPMLEFSLAQRGDGECIPNDLLLGGIVDLPIESQLSQSQPRTYRPRMMLLSGPNMGGKSTLLRQTCIIAILAQIGCWVPAEQVRMTPVDRIFTRVGASDRILAGQSTFFVELAETAIILNSATPHSLCILDELGRGTATFDGTAIAHSVVEHLVTRKRCRSLFATHYHSLVEDWSMDARVRLGHMECIVNSSTEVDASSTDRSEEVTFLYKLSDGSSPRSYGINVARLAGLPSAVISLALKQSRKFEDDMKKKTSQNIQSATNDSNIVSAAVHHTAEDKIKSLFEQLVTVAETSCTVDELAYLAQEMWRRLECAAKKIIF